MASKHTSRRGRGRQDSAPTCCTLQLGRCKHRQSNARQASEDKRADGFKTERAGLQQPNRVPTTNVPQTGNAPYPIVYLCQMHPPLYSYLCTLHQYSQQHKSAAQSTTQAQAQAPLIKTTNAALPCRRRHHLTHANVNASTLPQPHLNKTTSSTRRSPHRWGYVRVEQHCEPPCCTFINTRSITPISAAATTAAAAAASSCSPAGAGAAAVRRAAAAPRKQPEDAARC